MTLEVDARLRELVDRGKTPGVQYVVVDRSGVVFSLAAGSADIGAATPMTRATTMMAYSMSKTITAAAVLQLATEQRVGLDDGVERCGVAHPYGAGITARRLLSHTSGIPNPIPLRWVHTIPTHERFDEKGALAAVMRRHSRLACSPGARYRYSNLGYWLLGRLVEEVSGEHFVDYVEKNLLAVLTVQPGELGYAVQNPSGHATGYLEKHSVLYLLRRVLLDRALVGTPVGRWLSITGHYVNGPAFGGLVGSASGFAKFLQDQLEPGSRVLGQAARDLFYAQQRAGGHAIPMTLGWHMGSLGDNAHFYKEGGGGGFHCMMRLYPAHGVGTVLMTNATGFNVSKEMDTLDGRFLR